MKIKGVVFDKDGTLFHYAETWGSWCRRVLLELTEDDEELARKLAFDVGYSWESDTFISGSPIVGGAADEVNVMWSEALPNKSVTEIEAVGLKHLETVSAAPVGDFDKIFPALRELGLKLGVATNDFETGATSQLSAHDASKYFDFVAGFDSGYGSKPGPGQILGFCEVTDLSPKEVAMVGDSTHDLFAGQAAGVGLNVGVLTGPASRRDIEAAADVVFEDISHLPEYLKG